MKKTVTANIAGAVFHIEEDAYDRLQRYLTGIRANFAGSAGAQEIMGDIESRIAELFNARLSGRGVVTLEDVEHVEQVMGRPEDFSSEGAPVSGEDRPFTGGASAGKRFMRDPEDKWLAGVLGGLGAYLGFDPLWLRILVIVLVMASVGSVIPLYIILWILVPKAGSAADRLRMRGEPVTVENIKRTVEEGATRFAKEAGDLGKEWGPRAQQWGHEAGARMRDAGSGAAHIIRRLIGVVLIVIGFGLLLSMATGLVGGSLSLWHFATWNSEGMGMLDMGGLLFNSREHALWMAIGLFVLLAVPVLSVLLGGFNLLLGTRTPKWLGWTLAAIWFAAFIPVTIAGMDLARDFRRESTTRTEIPVTTPAGNVLYLDVPQRGSATMRDGIRSHDDDIDLDLDGLFVEDGIIYGPWAHLDVEPSPDSLYHLEVVREAHGRSTKEALQRAGNIGIDTRQEGDVLFVSPVVRFGTQEKLRGQDAHFTLRLPIGGSVFLRPGSRDIIYDIDNVTNTQDDQMIGRAWIMTEEGLREHGTQPSRTAPTPGKGSDGDTLPEKTTTASSTYPSRVEPSTALTTARDPRWPSLAAMLHRVVSL